MIQAAKRQRQVIGRMVNGELHVVADIVPFVSSRLGPYVSHETDHERDDEYKHVADAVSAFGGAGQ